MGPDGRIANSEQADAFFAQFIDAAPEVIARAEAESDTGMIPAILAEMQEFGYWDQKIAARAARRAAREAADTAFRAATAARFANPNEAARLAPLPAKSLALLPAPRLVTITAAERRAADRYFRRAGWKADITALVHRLELEGRRAPARLRREHRAFVIEQREFEHAQFRQVLDRRTANGRTAIDRRKAAARWTVISENRALEIALAALEKIDPPQGRK